MFRQQVQNQFHSQPGMGPLSETHPHLCTYLYAHTHTCAHTYSHTPTHTHTLSLSLSLSLSLTFPISITICISLHLCLTCIFLCFSSHPLISIVRPRVFRHCIMPLKFEHRQSPPPLNISTLFPLESWHFFFFFLISYSAASSSKEASVHRQRVSIFPVSVKLISFLPVSNI